MQIHSLFSSKLPAKLSGLLILGLLSLTACDDFLPPGGTSGSDTSSDSDSDPDSDPDKEVPAPGQACGGDTGVDCKGNQFCKLPRFAKCGEVADAVGVCIERPEECTKDYSPVCGCDGRTYGNACEADRAGVSTLHSGECKGPAPEDVGRACGGSDKLECHKALFCRYPVSAQCGLADALGVCSVRPDACTEEYDPVCGCDGTTYGNDCKADQAGVSIESKGACTEEVGEGQSCGGSTEISCQDGLFCKYRPAGDCGASKNPGACQLRPESCSKEYDPVCGCDGKTYGNPCEADQAGVSLLHGGECEPKGPQVGDACGLDSQQRCDGKLFCLFEESAQCGSIEVPGSCQVRPEVCTEEWNPVCGCDDKTYGNECKAHEVGISVKAQGRCN